MDENNFRENLHTVDQNRKKFKHLEGHMSKRVADNECIAMQHSSQCSTIFVLLAILNFVRIASLKHVVYFNFTKL